MEPAPDPLGRLVDAAREVVGASNHPTTAVTLSIMTGPCPIVLRGTAADLLTAFGDALMAGRNAPLPPLEISVVSAAEVDRHLIPDALWPGPDETIITRDGSRLAVASGLHRTLWILDPMRATAVLWIDEVDDVPSWELASPLFLAVGWWATEHGAALVHTGAVADAGGAVLLIGESGAGKSTTSMACFGHGLDVIGDDYCLIAQSLGTTPTAWVHGVYRRAKLDDHALGLLPGLSDRIAGPGPRNKHLIDLGRTPIDPKPIRAICEVVQRAGAPAHLLPLSPVRALRTIAPQTMAMQRLWERRVWDVLTTTVRTVPCYQLVVGSPSHAPEVLADLLSRQPGPTSRPATR